MKQPFTRAHIEDGTARVHLLRSNTKVKPKVMKVELDGKSWAVKDYSDCTLAVRSTYGRATVSHEYWVLEKLNGIAGIPSNPFVLDDYAVVYEFIEGEKFAACKERITTECLEKCEKLLEEFHKRGIVHLDTGSMSNWMLDNEGQPYLIDFQTATPLKRFPRKMRDFMIAMDYRGVLKKWKALHPDKMGEERAKKLKEINRIRKIWFIHH